ncbi:hypothetical protein [Streptomyces sp. SID14515]|uniref:hypothetical protein n=1 Tax=Streptomyces sp. SID14515 TaxID=2706074 RepID=UPI0013CC3B4E|nr:hypothetical protein [Streptomyces sp. SID14515]NEB41037.1 hypothetical protein [Streptomyces sp. SID14515]
MDVVRMLEAASLLVPEGVATDNDMTVSDVWDYLAHDEWEVALDLLQALGGAWTAPAGFWDELARVAGALGFERSREWCWWREMETRSGVIRADLTLLPADEGPRRPPIPGGGVLRPMWDTGTGAWRDGGVPDRALDIARVWVEFARELEPGARAPVRLLPLNPARWTHLVPGDRITLYETAVPGGTATILEVRRPEARPPEVRPPGGKSPTG